MLRAETGREFSAALVAVGALNVEVEMHASGGVELWCGHCGAGMCAARRRGSRRSRRARRTVRRRRRRLPEHRRAPEGEPWERTLRGVLAPPAEPGPCRPAGRTSPLAVRYQEHEPRVAKGKASRYRPAIRGSSGAWVRGGISSAHIAESDDPDPRWRALADIEGMSSTGRHNFAASADRLRRATAHGMSRRRPGTPLRGYRLDAAPSRAGCGTHCRRPTTPASSSSRTPEGRSPSRCRRSPAAP